MIDMTGAALLLLAAAPPAAQPGLAPAAAEPQLIVAAPSAPAEQAGAVLLPKGTMVRLMVVNEINTMKDTPGTRFVLRVDEDVAVNGAVVIPTGAKAWGEVTKVVPNKALGKPGSIGAKLLYADVPGGRIALDGEELSAGNKGGDRVAMAISGFGPFGLLARGTQGKLKAGFIFNGYVAQDRLFDPAAGTFLPEADQGSKEPGAQ
jgi:hypothetical protein